MKYSPGSTESSGSDQEFINIDSDDNSIDESLVNCFNCKSKYPPTKKKLKNIDWVQCDVCDEWFHEFCITRDKSSEAFTCNNCC